MDLTQTARQLAPQFNTPILNPRNASLAPMDLATTFPRLYIPADLVRVDMDWDSCLRAASPAECLSRLPTPVQMLLESTPATLVETRPAMMDRPSRATHLSVVLADGRQYPIKFNCRVIGTIKETIC